MIYKASLTDKLILVSTTFMSACTTCLSTLKSPVILPCAHPFCHDCISRAIHSVQPSTIHHWCPKCQSPYTIVNKPIPPQAPLSQKRKLFPAHDTHNHTSSEAASECARIREENLSMKAHANMWRRRAESHAGATLGLLGLARIAHDRATQMKRERDEWRCRYAAIKMHLDGGSESIGLMFAPSRFEPTDEMGKCEPASPTPPVAQLCLPETRPSSDAIKLDDENYTPPPPSKRRKMGSDTSSAQDRPRRSPRLARTATDSDPTLAA